MIDKIVSVSKALNDLVIPMPPWDGPPVPKEYNARGGTPMAYLKDFHNISRQRLAVPGDSIDQASPGTVLWLRNRRRDNLWLDESGKGNHGTIIGATWGDLTGGIWSVKFDGVDDYIQIPNSPSLDITGAFSIMSWVNRRVDTKYVIISAKVPAPIQYNFYWAIAPGGDDNKLHMSWFPTASKIGDNAHSQTGSWHLVACTYDLANVRFYFDGVPDGVVAELTPPSSNGNDVFIGNDQGGSLTDGKVADSRIYNRILSAEEIYNHFQRTRGYFRV